MEVRKKGKGRSQNQRLKLFYLLDYLLEQTDERSVSVFLTDHGEALKEKAVDIPAKVAGCVGLAPAEAAALYETLYKILKTE